MVFKTTVVNGYKKKLWNLKSIFFFIFGIVLLDRFLTLIQHTRSEITNVSKNS